MLRHHFESPHTKKKKIEKLMEFELIPPPKLCYTSIVKYVLWKLTVLFLSAGIIFAGATSSFWVSTHKKEKNRKINGIWINTPSQALLYQHCKICTLKTYSTISISWTNNRWCYVIILSLYRKKRKVDKTWINTTPTRFIPVM